MKDRWNSIPKNFSSLQNAYRSKIIPFNTPMHVLDTKLGINNRIYWEWVNGLIIIKSIQLMFVNYVNRIWLIIPLLLLVMRLFVVVKKIPSFILIILIMVLTKCPLSQDLSMIVICRVVYSLGFHFYVIPHEFGVDIPHKP